MFWLNAHYLVKYVINALMVSISSLGELLVNKFIQTYVNNNKLCRKKIITRVIINGYQCELLINSVLTKLPSKFNPEIMKVYCFFVFVLMVFLATQAKVLVQNVPDVTRRIHGSYGAFRDFSAEGK